MTGNADTLLSLLKSCLLAPTDDLPRLVLADFLDNETDMDSTVLRKPEGTWIIRTLMNDIGLRNTAVTYSSKGRRWNRWFSRNQCRIQLQKFCRCGHCEWVWHWTEQTPYPVDFPVRWRCNHCHRSRHRTTVEAIKKATCGGGGP